MANPGFQAEVTSIPGIPDAGEILLRGRITYNEAPALRQSIIGEMSKTPAAKMVLQLSGVEEMDTSGAAVLVEALKLGLSRGMRVLLCSPSESVLRIFRLAGFEEVLDHCCPNPEETERRLLE